MMQETEFKYDYSIIICTYNPDERILSRCLQAVYALDRSGLKTELILTDNNSAQAVRGLPCVRDFLKKIPEFKVTEVSKQGVKWARMQAIDLSKGKYIVYIDYDNEPSADYLQQLHLLNTKYSPVAAWGPGDITVDFLDGIDSKIEDYARIAFQEKHLKEITFSRHEEWQSYYPAGTGLCSFSTVLKDYLAEANKGRFSLTGRKGQQLSSGEDTEMILFAISKGYAAGSSPTLKLNHLISESRANISYLKRLAFGTANCYDTCVLEVFPEKQREIEDKMLPPGAFTRKAIKKFTSSLFGRNVRKTLSLAHWLGLSSGSYFAMNKKLPSRVKRIIDYLKLV